VSAVLTLWRYYLLLSWGTVGVVIHELVEANRATYLAYFRPEFCIARETVVYATGPLFLLLLLHSADASFLRRLRTIILCSVPAATSVAVWQKMSGAESLRLAVWGREGLQRVHGTLGDPNTLGAYLALLFPLLALETALCWWPPIGSETGASVVRNRGCSWVQRWATLASMLMATVTLVWSASRAAWVGTFVGLVFVARALSVEGGERLRLPRLPAWKSLRRYAVIAVVCAGVVLVAVGWFNPRPMSEWRSPADALTALFTVEGVRAEIRGRWLWWAPALRMGTGLPLTGVGVGNYRFFVDPYSPEPGRSGILGEPHNYYLKPLAELGVVGLGLFLWVCWSVWKSWRTPAPHLEKRCGLRRLAAGAGLLALAVNMVFQHALVQMEMQLITAAVVALAVFDGRDEAPRSGRTRSRSRLSLVLAAATLLAVVWSGRYRGDAVHDIALPAAEKWGAVTPTESGVRFHGAGGLKATVDQNLGRALIIIAARGQKVADRWPRLTVIVNGDYADEWTIDSASTKQFERLVFTLPGSNSFILQPLSDDDDAETGQEPSIDVESFKIVDGHMASYWSLGAWQ